MATAGRALAFDFGINHIGIAVGNEDLGTAEAVGAIKAIDGIPHEGQLQALLKEWRPEFLVVGLPLNMDGTEQEMTKRAHKFARRLMSKFALSVYLQDERLSSVAAKDEIFSQHGGYRTLVKHKDKIDAQAAKIILESFWDEGGRSGATNCLDPVQYHVNASLS